LYCASAPESLWSEVRPRNPSRVKKGKWGREFPSSGTNTSVWSSNRTQDLWRCQAKILSAMWLCD
jgi:hypothetical protein